jgi:hypothetical protein
MADYTTRFRKQQPKQLPSVLTQQKRLVSFVDLRAQKQINALEKKIRNNEARLDDQLAIIPTPEPDQQTSNAIVVYEMWSDVVYDAISETSTEFDTVTPVELLQGNVDFTGSFFIPISFSAPVLGNNITVGLRRATIALAADNNIYGIDEAFGINPVALGENMQFNLTTAPVADDGLHVSVWTQPTPGVFIQDTAAVFTVPQLTYAVDQAHVPGVATGTFLTSQQDGKVKIWADNLLPGVYVYDAIQSFNIQLQGVDGSGNDLIVAPIIYTKPVDYDVR